MADDESRKDDAEKRPGSSKPDKKSGKKDDAAKKPSKKDKAEAKAAKKSGKDTGKDKGDEKPDPDDSSAVKTAKAADGDKKKGTKRRGPLGRLLLFLREVVEQLRKVVYPTRKQLLTYTLVVLIYVSIMIAIVSGLDLGFQRVVAWVFGGAE